jgi:putative membrane protein
MLNEAVHLLGVGSLSAVCAYRLVPLVLNTRSWQLLLPAAGRPRFVTLLRLRWMGEAINGVLPVGQVGGDLARAHLVAARGVHRADAAASMVGDLGTGIVTQAVFGIAGALALAGAGATAVAPTGGRLSSRLAVTGLTAAAILVVAMVVLLRSGMSRLRQSVLLRSSARWAALSGGLAHFEEALTKLLARRRALAGAFGWHLAGWFSQLGETWILLTLFGAPCTLSNALAIEGMGAAARTAVFFIPGGLGVQEVTVVTLSHMLGGGYEPALALGLAKRVRELALGVPGVLAWIVEERPALRRWHARLEAQRQPEPGRAPARAPGRAIDG